MHNSFFNTISLLSILSFGFSTLLTGYSYFMMNQATVHIWVGVILLILTVILALRYYNFTQFDRSLFEESSNKLENKTLLKRWDKLLRTEIYLQLGVFIIGALMLSMMVYRLFNERMSLFD